MNLTIGEKQTHSQYSTNIIIWYCYEKWYTKNLEKSRNRQMYGNMWLTKTEKWIHETPKFPASSNNTNSIIHDFVTTKSPGLNGFTDEFTTFL